MTTLLEKINSHETKGTISDLVFPVSNTYDFSNKKKVIFINTSDIHEGKFMHQNLSDVETLPGQAKKTIEHGDILFSEIRPKNRHFALVDFDAKEYVVSTKLIVLRVKKNIDPSFAYIVLTADKNLKEFQNIAESRSGTFPQITFDSIADYEIRLPELNIQKKIAEILSSYDAKIENNTRIVKNLELTAETIFNEWFVKFRFPENEKVKFTESEIGEIPVGWEIKSLDQIADFLNGIALQKFPAEGQSESLPVIKIREMNSGIDNNTERASHNIDKKYIIRDGDILFSWSGSLELMLWTGGNGALNQHIFKVTSENYPKWFFYQWVKYHLQNFRAIASGKATTMGHIQRHHLSEAKVVIPDKHLFKIIDGLMSKLFDEELRLELENVVLRESRDRLLAKLI